jgi:hypothetical protein
MHPKNWPRVIGRLSTNLYVDAVIIVLNEHNISQIGGDTKVKPKKYTLLLIPYKIMYIFWA